MNNIENQLNTKDNFQNGSLKENIKGALSHTSLKSAFQNPNNSSTGDIQAPSFKKELEQYLSAPDTVDININEILEDMDINSCVNLDTVNIDKIDAMFFINLTNQAGITNYTMSSDGALIDAMNYKTIEVSKTLSDLLLKAKETKGPIRLDFDNNVTVVLKLNESGKLNAHFIPGDKAVEEYLRNNIPYLKQRFDEQNIPYANISYRNHRQRENGQNNKEKKSNE